MRLWSLHPKYLDAKGIVALWREALLARQVLTGLTNGYQSHPQLHRFKEAEAPLACLEYYLYQVLQEALARGYRFDATKVNPTDSAPVIIPVSTGQLAYELEHLRRKLQARDPAREKHLPEHGLPVPHPLFQIIPGAVAPWEKY